MGELAVLVGVEVVEGANSIVRGVGLGANGEENEENEKTGRPDHTSFRCCKINNNSEEIRSEKLFCSNLVDNRFKPY